MIRLGKRESIMMKDENKKNQYLNDKNTIHSKGRQNRLPTPSMVYIIGKWIHTLIEQKQQNKHPILKQKRSRKICDCNQLILVRRRRWYKNSMINADISLTPASHTIIINFRLNSPSS